MKPNDLNLKFRQARSLVSSTVVVWGVGLLLGASLNAGTLQLTSPNPVSGGAFGASWGYSYGLPDLNGDQKGELQVCAPSETVRVTLPAGGFRDFRKAGRVYVFDGATAGLLYSITSPHPAENGMFYGASVAGDVNGDGVEDLMIPDEGGQAGVLYFFDGRNGRLLSELRSPNPSSPLGGFGFAASTLDDVDNDGHFDWLVGEGRWSDSAGNVYVFTGATRKMLWKKSVTQLGRMGFGCRALPDLNGDGAGEVAIGYPKESSIMNGRLISEGGLVKIFNGVNGMPLHTLTAPEVETQDRFGERLQCLGDVDGDHVPDLIVGSHFAGPGEEGRAWVFSGANGHWIRTLTSPIPHANGRFGWEVLPVPDQTGDGITDIVVMGYQETYAFVFDGATGANVDSLRSPTLGRFWIGTTFDDEGSRLGSWVFAQESAGGSGRVSLVSERAFPPHLNFAPQPGGQYRLSYRGEMNQEYSVEASEDLEQWAEIGRFPLAHGATYLTLSNCTPSRFFRLQKME